MSAFLHSVWWSIEALKFMALLEAHGVSCSIHHSSIQSQSNWEWQLEFNSGQICFEDVDSSMHSGWAGNWNFNSFNRLGDCSNQLHYFLENGVCHIQMKQRLYFIQQRKSDLWMKSSLVTLETKTWSSSPETTFIYERRFTVSWFETFPILYLFVRRIDYLRHFICKYFNYSHSPANHSSIEVYLLCWD